MDVAPLLVAPVRRLVGHFLAAVRVGVRVLVVEVVGAGGRGVGQQQALLGGHEGVVGGERALGGRVVLGVGVELAVYAVFVYAGRALNCILKK